MDGTITRKDIITDDALRWGDEYAKTLNDAIAKNREFVDSIILLNAENVKLRRSENQTEFIKQKNEVKLLAEKSIVTLKEQQIAETNLEKVKQEALKTEKLALDVANKKQAAIKAGTKLSIEERVANEYNNRVLKQEALERLGLVSSYTKLNKARTDAKNNLRDLIASEKASTAEIQKAQKAFDGYDAKIKKADKAVGDFSKNVGNYKSAFSGIGNLFGAFGLVGGVAGFVAVTKSIFDTTKELQSLELALKSVTETQDNFAEQQLFLSGISEKYGLEIKNLTKQYTAFYVAAKDKLSGNEIQQIFEDISRSGSALGLSNETLERSFQAVNQMLSKGVVASEELRGQLAESMPGAVQAMTKAVQKLHPEIKNLTEKGLFEMIKSGKILANEVLPETARQLTLITGADKAEGIDTLSKTTNRLTNSWTKMISSINDTDTSGFGIFVKKIVGGLTTILDFTGLLFKDENQLSNYFQNIGKSKGLEEYQAIMKNISTVSVEQQEITKKALLERERETIRVNQAIIKAEKAKRESIIGGDRALFHLQTKQEEDALVQLGKSSAIIKKLKGDALNSSVKATKNTVVTEETSKEKVAREKAAKEALERAKKLSDSLYELQKQRLERSIKINSEIASDDKLNDDVRIKALEVVQSKEIALAELTKKHSLDADKFVTAENKLNANQKLIIANEAANKIVDINKKTAEEILKINQFDEAKYQKDLEDKVSKVNVAMNAELQAENERFAALGDLEAMAQADREKAIEDHETRIFNIKKEFAIKTLKLQIANLEAELVANDALPANEQISADKRQKIAETLSKAKLDLSEVEVSTTKNNSEKIVLTEIEKTEKILEISSALTGALTDLGNAFTERKIQKIDEEIEKNNEYYDKQIELAGDDERQKDLLQKERDKKNEALEKKKQKEHHKQAVFNKATAIAQATISASLAVLAALSTQPFLPMGPIMATLAGVLGAIQIATIIATPIPKYKMGRKGGPAETAWVGDGGVSEVITSSKGMNPRLTPNIPTLTHLNEGDIVHKSTADYQAYMRASILSGLQMDGRRMNDFQAKQNNDLYGKESLEVMKETLSVLKKQKNGTVVNMPGLDINHYLWKMGNTNWN